MYYDVLESTVFADVVRFDIAYLDNKHQWDEETQCFC